MIIRRSLLAIAFVHPALSVVLSQIQPDLVATSTKAVAQTTTPIIRATTRLVQASVVITDKKGQPVTGLKKEDFTVLDKDQPQDVAVFSAEAPTIPSQPVRTLPPNNFTNRRDALGEAPGSNTIILFDALNTSPSDQARALDQVLKFLRTIQPQDHFAIYGLINPARVDILHEFTQDDSALIKAIKNYTIKPPDSDLAPFANAMNFAGLPTAMLPMVPVDSLVPRTAQEVEQLRDDYNRFRIYPLVGSLINIANHVSGIPGRKNLIWISGGVSLDLHHLPNRVRLSQIGYKLESPEFADTGFELMRAVAESFNLANVVMYGVDVHGVQVDASFDPSQRAVSTNAKTALGRINGEQALRDTYRLWADQTGGTAFYGNNDIAEGLTHAFDDGRYAYTLGYYPNHGNWDGSFRKIQIKVNGDGFHLRYRDGYIAAPASASDQDQEKQLQEAAISPLDASALSMMVSARHVEPVTTRELDFQVGINVAQLLLRHSAGLRKGSIDLIFVQKDSRAGVIAVDKKHLELDFSDEQYQSLLRAGAIFERHLPLLPDAKDVRVMVRDAGSGQLGTVTMPLSKFFSVGQGTPQENK